MGQFHAKLLAFLVRQGNAIHIVGKEIVAVYIVQKDNFGSLIIFKTQKTVATSVQFLEDSQKMRSITVKSRAGARPRIFRLFMKGKFELYVL